MKNIKNAFLGHFRTLDIFDQKTKQLDLGEIYFVLNFQGCARCATGVASKRVKMRKKIKKSLPKNVVVYTFI